MKKIASLLVAAAAFVGTHTASAQTGPISFNGYDAGLNFYVGTTATPAPGDGTIFFTIFAGGNALTPIGQSSSIMVLGADAPTFDYGNAYTGAANDATGVAFRIEAWQGAVGNPGTYAGAVGNTPTKSLDWTQQVGTQLAGSPPPLPSTRPLTFGGATELILVVPEPATITLGILGGIALLARRRRDQSV